MATVCVIALSFLLATALSDSVTEETKTLFLGEDFHLELRSPDVDVKFRNGSDKRAGEVFLMRQGKAVPNSRAKLNAQASHLVIDALNEGDEGVYTVKNQTKEFSRIKLIVRDCNIEEYVKYGENYRIQLSGIHVTGNMTLEHRRSDVEANQTAKPGVMVLTSTGKSTGSHEGRISINERYITISAVTGTDEGSYTVRDDGGFIQKKVCLNVKEHQNFMKLPYGKTLKINLMLNSSLVQLHYIRATDPKSYLLLDKGEFIMSAVTELRFEDRISLDGSWVYLDQVKGSDVGLFKITDIQGFPVSSVHMELLPYKLESLYVAIIALLGLLVFLLLVCLLSCLFKVKKRAKRAAALEKLAQNAGKEDEGEAFREVVKNITKLSEESKHSQADNTEKSQSTEVDIKGLEVSSKEVGVDNLETSDSGVGFNTALPLDTDTDAPDHNLDSVAISISESKPSPPPAAAAAAAAAAESQPSAPPALEIKSSPVAEIKLSPAPETKKTPEKPAEAKLDVPKAADVKLSPASSPEPNAGLSPADAKPAPTPSPEPKSPAPKSPASKSPAPKSPAPKSPAPKSPAPKAPSPAPESKSSLAPAPESPKPTTPEPITNGTPEPGPDSKPSPEHVDIISPPKAAPPKTPEVELKSSGAALEGSKDGAVAEDSTTTTTTT